MLKKIVCMALCFVFLLTGIVSGICDSFVVVDDEKTAPDVLFQARVMMRSMTDMEKICQLFIVAPEDLTGEKRVTALPVEGNVFSLRPVGGVMLFGQNIVSESQLAQLTDRMNRDAAQAGLYPLFIAVEEEGGLVSRVANKLGYPLAPSPNEIGETNDPAQAKAAGQQIGGYLKPLGINLCFAPTADTMLDKDTIGLQSYGTDPLRVARMAASMAEGLRENGVTPCYTHFPGHGAIEGTLLKNVSIKRTAAEMRGWEFLPFADGIRNDIEMILVSHGMLRLMEDDVPASTSNRVINGILRDELGYQGVVVTDSLRMAAVTSIYKTGQECVAALKAGADILLLPPDLSAGIRAIQNAIQQGELTMARIEESVARILAVKIRWSQTRK